MVIGTGIIGSVMCIPLAAILGFADFAVKPLMLMFLVSSIIGAIISYIILMILKHITLPMIPVPITSPTAAIKICLR